MAVSRFCIVKLEYFTAGAIPCPIVLLKLDQYLAKARFHHNSDFVHPLMDFIG